MGERALRALFAAGPLTTADVVAFRERHALGVPAELEVVVNVAEYLDPEELLGAGASLAFGQDGAERRIQGFVESVAMIASPLQGGAGAWGYRLRVVSAMALLEHSVGSWIFQELDVREIVAGVLEQGGIDADHQSWRLTATYPKREYCVQYGESALAFVRRLLEEEGIYFHSEAGDAGEVIVFCDDSTAADPIDGDPVVRFKPAHGLGRDVDAFTRLTEKHRRVPGQIVLRDFDFERPSLDLTAKATAADDPDLELYDYPGLYIEKSEGERLARVRLEALQAERSVLRAQGKCPRLAPGRTVTVSGAPGSMDADYLVTGVVHTLGLGGEGTAYTTEATLIAKSTPFRTPQTTPRPIIDGPQTAEVVAPPGSPAEEIHTDEHGRCKVKFHWDLAPGVDDKASCWMRVSQLQTSGSMVLPRVGWEVIVEFLEGNPDRPIVTGRLYNGLFMPPYALPEGKTRTAIQTASTPGGGGMNEIRFEDKAGSEEISIGAQKNQTLATANNKTKSVGVDESKNVGVDSTLTIGANQDVKVTSGYQQTVGSSQTVSVGGSRTLQVNAVLGLTSKGASSTSVGGGQMEMIGSPLQGLITLAVQTATEAAQAKAAEALQQLDAAVQSKVDQVMGPINGLQQQVAGVSDGMAALGNGDLGAAAGALAGAAGLPMPGDLAGALGGGGATASKGGGAAEAGGGHGGGAAGGGGASAASGLDALVKGAIDSGAGKIGEALGASGGGGGGESAANKAGPEGAVGGNSAADSACGPGHSINKLSSTYTENVGSLKVTLSVGKVATTATAARKQDIGAARIELVGGNRIDACLADKTEKAIGLVVLCAGPESESVGGSRSTSVGGAILEKVGADYAVSAGGTATFVGSLQKVDASGSITFKCGGSEVVIDGGGVSIKSTLVMIGSPNIKLTKNVTEI